MKESHFNNSGSAWKNCHDWRILRTDCLAGVTDKSFHVGSDQNIANAVNAH